MTTKRPTVEEVTERIAEKNRMFWRALHDNLSVEERRELLDKVFDKGAENEQKQS